MRSYPIAGIAGFVAGVLTLLVLSAAAHAAVPGKDVTYTLDADFDKGTAVNLNHEAVHHQLQLNKGSGAFPSVWVALSQRCTIAKINTETGAILGEYRTLADDRSCPESSRTTVALDGSVWVGHRFESRVTHVGLAELNQCADRNGNGTIETSTGYGDVKAWPGAGSSVADAQDECILHHVVPPGFGDSRHMSVDANNNLWVGDYAGGHNFARFNGATGVMDVAPRSFECGGYGGLIDGAGVIWSSNSGGAVLRWDPNAPDSATNPRCIPVANYGLAVDKNGWVWTSPFGSAVYKISPDGNTVLGPFPHGNSGAQGLAVTPDGDVWVSSSLSCSSNCTIGHLKNDGTFVGSVPNPTGSGSTGVSVDAAGKVWTANRESHTATRIDPAAGPIGADGVTHVGAVDLTVDFPVGPDSRPLPYPYNYSDMTGAQLLATTAPQGTWTVTQDGGAAGTKWGKVLWTATTPAGASVTVEARAAGSEAALGSQPYVGVGNGAAFNLTGRFVQVRVTMKPTSGGVSPELKDIRVCDVAGCNPPVVVGGVAGEGARSCASRRNFGIRIRVPVRGASIRSARVWVNGKRVTVTKRGRFRARVNLRGLPRGRFTVRIVVITTDGRRFEGKRRYRTCTQAKPPKRVPRI